MQKKINNFYFLMTLENVAVQLFGTLTYLLLLHLEYSLVEIGYFLAIFTAITMITEIPSGVLVDSIGAKRVLISSFLLRAIGLLIMANAHNVIILSFSGVITGIAASLSSGTLESWIVNEIKKSDSDYDIGQLFSKLNVIGPFFGLIAGFIGAQILGKDNPAIPFYISAILYLFLMTYVLLAKNIFNEEMHAINMKEINRVYRETISSLIEVFKDFRITLFFILFTIPGVIDLGPSNQWQVVLNESVQNYIVGYYIVGIGIVTILSNLFLSHFLLKKKIDTIVMIDKVLILDVMTLFIMSLFSQIFPCLFLFHVFLVGINGTLMMTYIHDILITKNHLRTSIVSAFYSLQALITCFKWIFIANDWNFLYVDYIHSNRNDVLFHYQSVNQKIFD